NYDNDVGFINACVGVVVDEYRREDFPNEFVFGSGTSAYQACLAPKFSGYYNGANGDIACDGYHKYKEDIQLMANMGLEAFRFPSLGRD
nr:beta-glucosidase 11-like isoform X1 [Tanacetum cinerariifolium]